MPLRDTISTGGSAELYYRLQRHGVKTIWAAHIVKGCLTKRKRVTFVVGFII